MKSLGTRFFCFWPKLSKGPRFLCLCCCDVADEDFYFVLSGMRNLNSGKKWIRTHKPDSVLLTVNRSECCSMGGVEGTAWWAPEDNKAKGKIVSLNGGMCMRAKLGGCVFLMKRRQNRCSRCLMVIFQSAVNLSQPTDTWSESSGCSRKEETFTISLGKVGET